MFLLLVYESFPMELWADAGIRLASASEYASGTAPVLQTRHTPSNFLGKHCESSSYPQILGQRCGSLRSMGPQVADGDRVSR